LTVNLNSLVAACGEGSRPTAVAGSIFAGCLGKEGTVDSAFEPAEGAVDEDSNGEREA
jgi:hypothetical protein